MKNNNTNYLSRFVEPAIKYKALIKTELSKGQKLSCWMWYTFPQIKGLGRSEHSEYFAIQSRAHALHYLAHFQLGNLLRDHTRLVLSHRNLNIKSIFSLPDNLKFQSSMTLFSEVSEKGSLFEEAINIFFDGKKCQKTLDFLNSTSEHHTPLDFADRTTFTLFSVVTKEELMGVPLTRIVAINRDFNVLQATASEYDSSTLLSIEATDEEKKLTLSNLKFTKGEATAEALKALHLDKGASFSHLDHMPTQLREIGYGEIGEVLGTFKLNYEHILIDSEQECINLLKNGLSFQDVAKEKRVPLKRLMSIWQAYK
jgi:uncharacterized protein (DUF1810 family)